MDWINPDVWIHMTVAYPTQGGRVDGGRRRANGALQARILPKTSLEIGTKIVVDGYRAKDGTNKMNARQITLSDGRKLFAGSRNSQVGQGRQARCKANADPPDPPSAEATDPPRILRYSCDAAATVACQSPTSPIVELCVETARRCSRCGSPPGRSTCCISRAVVDFRRGLPGLTFLS